MNKNILALLALCAAFSTTQAAPSDIEFSTFPADSQLMLFGTGKNETYDLAIKLNDRSLAGAQIKGLSVQLAPGVEVSDAKGWLSSALLVNSSKKNAPDICTVDAEVSDGMLSVRFAEPYTLTDKDVYAGYSITVSNIDKIEENKKPILFAQAASSDEMVYIHTSRTYRKWAQKYPGYVNPIVVTLSGEFPDNALGVISVSESFVKKDSEGTAAVVVANHGTSEIKSIGYTVSIDGKKSEPMTYTLPSPIAPRFGSRTLLNMPIPAQSVVGEYTIAFEIEEVNGTPNADPVCKAEGRLNIMSFVPVNRPLMEEYTGLWCGWCPRGYIALERMSKLHKDDFVGVSYHSGDDMELLTGFPSQVGGFPGALVNRIYDVDPYYGMGNDDFGIEKFYLDLAKSVPVADVWGSLEWSDAEQTGVIMHGNARFVKSIAGADYRLSYILLADGLQGTEEIPFRQTNNYKGVSEEECPGEDWKVFTEGEKVVSDLVFNDIAIRYEDQTGVEGSLPADIEADKYYKHDYSYQWSDIANAKGVNPVADKSKVRGVIVLTDAHTGAVVNSARTGYVAPSGVKGVTADGVRVVESRWYDLQGRRVKECSKGMLIRVDCLANGKSVSQKVMNR